jgi:hypothetical protein
MCVSNLEQVLTPQLFYTHFHGQAHLGTYRLRGVLGTQGTSARVWWLSKAQGGLPRPPPARPVPRAPSQLQKNGKGWQIKPRRTAAPTAVSTPPDQSP